MKLYIGDKQILTGNSFGAFKPASGEVVFNTGMSGYVETLTDPSYRGQILVCTYPLQGNYGVPDGPFESSRIQVQGLVVHYYNQTPSHHSSKRSLGEWLKLHGIPAIEGIDTRSLTQLLRNHGTINGRLEIEKSDFGPQDMYLTEDVVDMNKVLNLVAPEKQVYYPGGELKILLIDTGSKENIVRSFQKLGASVLRVPWNHQWENHLGQFDGVMLTNGPGDPQTVSEEVLSRIRKYLDTNIPMFGICFGHQLLSRAVGGKTYKLKFGHRSLNQPVLDLFTHRSYLTSQNHGYAVDSSSLPSDWRPWFTNLNDGSNEGIKHIAKPFMSVQFHPEATAGPRDTNFMFEDFMKLVGEYRSLSSPMKKRA